MALTKVTGQVIKNTTDVTVGVLTVTNTLAVGGTVSIGGTLTYEDVTNVDAVGLITARNGIVVGSGITLSKDGDVFFTGIATGNGSGLTALNASNISSGTVPTARLGSGTASSSTFLAGDSTFKTVTGTTINNNADNRLITGSGTANTLEGESNFTFDGATTTITNSSGLNKFILKGDVSGGALGASLQLRNTNSANNGLTDIQFLDPGSNTYAKIQGTNLTDGSNNGFLTFFTSSATAGLTEKLRLTDEGTFTNSQSANAPTSGGAWGFTQDQLYLSSSGTGANYALRFYNDNGLVGSALVNGSGTTYNTSSDYRLKENVVTISDGITRLKQLKPYRFNFKADASTTLDGFFAHEAQSVVPEAVSGTKDQVANADDVADGLASAIGDPVHQGIDQSKLVPLLTAALQEAVTKIEALEARVATLEGS